MPGTAGGEACVLPEGLEILILVTQDSRPTITSLLMHTTNQPYDWSGLEQSATLIGRLAPILPPDWLIGSNTSRRLDD